MYFSLRLLATPCMLRVAERTIIILLRNVGAFLVTKLTKVEELYSVLKTSVCLAPIPKHQNAMMNMLGHQAPNQQYHQQYLKHLRLGLKIQVRHQLLTRVRLRLHLQIHLSQLDRNMMGIIVDLTMNALSEIVRMMLHVTRPLQYQIHVTNANQR